MFTVYILKSTKFGRHYIGSTADIVMRLKEHNDGSVRSTKAFRPWVVVYQERFETKTEARKRENGIKKYKSGAAFQRLVTSWVGTEAVNRGRL